MKKNVGIADVMNLSVAERIRLVEDIWDSVAAMPEAVTLTEVQKQELDRRLAAYHADPESGSPWGEVKSRIQQSA